ncbi:MAG: triphosphoribosyl-dephospho-CoA synthase [Suipraeoptans sp.]
MLATLVNPIIITECEKVSDLAYKSLIEEVFTTPKPGLVDAYSSGAHLDMDINTFIDSANAIKQYYCEMVYIGAVEPNTSKETFYKVRKCGMEAEAAMFGATSGVNTHKGLIFGIGVFSAAYGICLRKGIPINLYNLVREEMTLVTQTLTKELKEISDNARGKGARGEALNGYSSAVMLGLPTLIRGVSMGKNWNLVKLHTLFTLMEKVSDANVLSRGGSNALLRMRERAGDFLVSGGAYKEGAIGELISLDKDFTKENISPGGCADLLAVSIFLYYLLGGVSK